MEVRFPGITDWISKVPVIKCDFICRVGLAGCRYVSESRMSHQKYSNVGQKEERGIWVNISFLSFLFLTLKLQMVFYRWSTVYWIGVLCVPGLNTENVDMVFGALCSSGGSEL